MHTRVKLIKDGFVNSRIRSPLFRSFPPDVHCHSAFWSKREGDKRKSTEENYSQTSPNSISLSWWWLASSPKWLVTSGRRAMNWFTQVRLENFHFPHHHLLHLIFLLCFPHFLLSSEFPSSLIIVEMIAVFSIWVLFTFGRSGRKREENCRRVVAWGIWMMIMKDGHQNGLKWVIITDNKGEIAKQETSKLLQEIASTTFQTSPWFRLFS